jgi:hypothetical protein
MQDDGRRSQLILHSCSADNNFPALLVLRRFNLRFGSYAELRNDKLLPVVFEISLRVAGAVAAT